MFEHFRQPLLHRAGYLRRVGHHAGIAVALVCGSLLIGTSGYHFLEGLGWVDALLDASMILTGMGPVHELHTTAGKLFASGYALFSGVVFLTLVAVLFAPVVHRFLHRFHIGLDDASDDSDS